jgi:hypothetical protein
VDSSRPVFPSYAARIALRTTCCASIRGLPLSFRVPFSTNHACADVVAAEPFYGVGDDVGGDVRTDAAGHPYARR